MHAPRSPFSGKNHCFQPLCCWFCCDCCFSLSVGVQQNNVHWLRAPKAPSLLATPTTKNAAKKAKKNRKDQEEDNTAGGVEKGKDQSRDNRATISWKE